MFAVPQLNFTENDSTALHSTAAMHCTAWPDLHSNVLHCIIIKVKNIEGAGPSKKKQARISQVKVFVTTNI